MQFHELKKATPNKKAKLVGRGGTRGKTSGRGHKGQKAHGGHGIRQQMRDIIKKLPKLRGRGKNSNKSIYAKAVVINLAAIEAAYNAGDLVNPMTLGEKKLYKNVRSGTIKILGTGELSKKLSFEGVEVSEAAKAKIEKAGGTIA